MARTEIIGGYCFEVIRSKHTDRMIEQHGYDYLNRTSLYDFYDNPSSYKIAIWDEWQEWYKNNDCVTNLAVIAGSTYAFTIGAFYIDPETLEILGYFRITRDHNYLYLYK